MSVKPLKSQCLISKPQRVSQPARSMENKDTTLSTLHPSYAFPNLLGTRAHLLVGSGVIEPVEACPSPRARSPIANGPGQCDSENIVTATASVAKRSLIARSGKECVLPRWTTWSSGVSEGKVSVSS